MNQLWHIIISSPGKLATALLSLTGRLPLCVLYPFSDLLAFLTGNVLKYRRKVILSNLRESFPEKDDSEIKRICHEFYRFLTDYFVETLHLAHISKKEIERRMTFEGIDKAAAALASGKDVSLLLGHYGNWEWVSTIPLHIHEKAQFGQIYHPLENKSIDSFFLKLRQRFGACSIPMTDTLSTLRKWRAEGYPSITGYIADQAPGFNGIHLWLDFLNHDTPVYTGPERLSRMLDAEVYYIDITRPERGRYNARFVLICDNPASMDRFAITRRYFELLEQTICRTPQLWLWSHRRWKRTRQQFEQYYGNDARRQLNRL